MERAFSVSSKQEEKELNRAYSTYLNVTSPGQYDLPNTTYGKQILSNKKNSPYFSMKSRTRLPYFPQCKIEFQGKDAPPCITYSPDTL